MTRALRACALIAAVAAPVFAAPAALSAQTTPRSVGLGVSGGLSLPVGDFGDGRKSGYTIAGHVYYKPASFSSVRLRGDVAYDRFDLEGVNANTRSLGVVGNLLYDFPVQNTSSITRPYVLGGLGLFNVGTASANASREGDTNLGFQVGGGLNFNLTGFSTFAEAKFVNVFGDGGSTRFIPITFGVRF